MTWELRPIFQACIGYDSIWARTTQILRIWYNQITLNFKRRNSHHYSFGFPWILETYSHSICFGCPHCPHQTSFVPQKWQDREVALTAVRSSGAALRHFQLNIILVWGIEYCMIQTCCQSMMNSVERCANCQILDGWPSPGRYVVPKFRTGQSCLDAVAG